MTPTDPLPLHHSWPLFAGDGRFDLGRLHDRAGGTDGRGVAGDLARWSCDLATEVLDWSPAVYALFGLDAARVPLRADVLRLYRAESLDPLERLRAHAIRHRRGFTLDTRIATARGVDRWLRIVAAPTWNGARVVTLAGVKQDVTHLYRR